jgi:hypothetical protein
MRVLLSTCDSRGGVEPLLGLALLEAVSRFVTPVQMPCCAPWRQAASDRS